MHAIDCPCFYCSFARNQSIATTRIVCSNTLVIATDESRAFNAMFDDVANVPADGRSIAMSIPPHDTIGDSLSARPMDDNVADWQCDD